MKKILFIWFCTPMLLNAQQEKGIRFEEGLNWSQVKAKAKAEHKNIFVDCFATWCGPCKRMDKEVYATERTGEIINADFISVKVQMDTSKEDNAAVKSWYADAHQLMTENAITAFPTYLFYNSDGKLVHKDLGYKPENDFVKVAGDAKDPSKQIFTLIEKYRQGQKDYSLMPYMARTVKELLKDRKLSIEIAQDYLQNYLYKQNEKILYSKDNLLFIYSFIQSTQEKGFNVFYKHGEKADAILGFKNGSRSKVENLITKEEVEAKIWKDNAPAVERPDWEKLGSTIGKKYNKAYAERIIINSKLKWYEYKKDWAEQAKYQIERMDKYGMDTAGLSYLFVNNMIWEVFFLHTNDTYSLNKAIGWLEQILKLHPDQPTEMDTYANLLYKVGRTAEAIAVEEKARVIDEETALKRKGKPDKTYAETVEKMRKGIPTWPVNTTNP